MPALRDLQHDFYDMLMESQYWPAEQLVAYQREQLEHLVRHARANVPFYEHRLDCLFTRHGDIDWDRWHDVPIVKRSDMIEHRDAMQARTQPEGHTVAGTIWTSGSTGLPISITVSSLSIMASNVARWRADRWFHTDWSKILYIRQEAPRAIYPEGLRRGAWGPAWEGASKEGRTFILNRTATTSEQLEFLLRVGAHYMATGPKPATTIALEAERQGVSVSLMGVLASGEAVTAEDAATYARVFGAKVVELYSSKEAAHMAYRCTHSSNWHVNDELLLLEVVDHSGHPCIAGESGRVVVTPFLNTAQPLIRYELGDLAIAGAGCPTCGRMLSTISELQGRLTHMFRHPDGRHIARQFPERYRDMLCCREWQIAQVGNTEFELRYVPLDWEVVGDEATVRTAFREWYFEDAVLTFKRTPELRPIGEKLVEYVYEVPT